MMQESNFPKTLLPIEGVAGSDASILARCQDHGIDLDRLEACLSSHDNWGKMIHAFDYLTVLEVVLNAMRAARNG